MNKGDKVTIYNETMMGETIVEGVATLVRHIRGDRWLVRFPEDARTYERFVFEKDKV